MRLLSWNISYQNHVISKIELIKKYLKDDMVIVLMEVVEKDYFILKQAFENSFHISYSLDLRKPSAFDTRSRKLGVVILVSKAYQMEAFDVLNRTPFPDRTGYVMFSKEGHHIKLLGLHSITGVDYKKTKSIQFYSFAESIDSIKPDIVCMDINEPNVDHPNIKDIEFHSNKDSGNGAKTFFYEMYQHNLQDTLRQVSQSLTIPLTVSYKTNKNSSLDNEKFYKRYDYIFVNINKYNIENVTYLYEESIKAGSDHAMIMCDVTLKS